jgi:hypothetical protein
MIVKSLDNALQNIENDSNTPVVDFFSIAFSFDDFWSNVARCSTGSGGKFSLDESSKTKVSDLDNCLFVS